MLKKALWVIIPFLLIFLLGLALLLRPHFHVPIVHVVNNFTRQEKTSQRSSHRHTVDYATVKVELDGTEHEVTVHDNTWKPLKPGDTVLVNYVIVSICPVKLTKPLLTFFADDRDFHTVEPDLGRRRHYRERY